MHDSSFDKLLSGSRHLDGWQKRKALPEEAAVPFDGSSLVSGSRNLDGLQKSKARPEEAAVPFDGSSLVGLRINAGPRSRAQARAANTALNPKPMLVDLQNATANCGE